MRKLERNKEIIKRCTEIIKQMGVDRYLKMFPIETPYTRRPSFWKTEEGTCFFSAFMWQLNELNDREIELELRSRVKTAIKHFGLNEITKPISFDTSLIGQNNLRKGEIENESDS